MIVKHFSIEAILLASEEIHTIEIISSVDGMGIFTPLDSLGRGPWPLAYLRSLGDLTIVRPGRRPFLLIGSISTRTV